MKGEKSHFENETLSSNNSYPLLRRFDLDAVYCKRSVPTVQVRHQIVHQHSHSERQALARGIQRIDRYLWQLPFRYQSY